MLTTREKELLSTLLSQKVRKVAKEKPNPLLRTYVHEMGRTQADMTLDDIIQVVAGEYGCAEATIREYLNSHNRDTASHEAIRRRPYAD